MAPLALSKSLLQKSHMGYQLHARNPAFHSQQGSNISYNNDNRELLIQIQRSLHLPS